jgi:hypothetical protein
MAVRFELIWAHHANVYIRVRAAADGTLGVLEVVVHTRNGNIKDAIGAGARAGKSFGKVGTVGLIVTS